MERKQWAIWWRYRKRHGIKLGLFGGHLGKNGQILKQGWREKSLS